MQKPSERLKRKVEKENLWLFILTLLRDNGKLTGAEIRKLLLEKMKVRVGTVTSYKVLYLLERGGYVKREKEGRRKLYSIAEAGMEELMKAEELLQNYVKLLRKHARGKRKVRIG